MALLASGDEQALDRLMRRHARRLLGQVSRIVRNHADAEEIVYETFLRVFRYRLDYNFESAFTSWLYVIGSRLAFNLLRWRARHPEFVPAQNHTAHHFATDELIDFHLTPCQQAEDDEWMDALEESLAVLSKQQRDALLLASLDGCSHAEIAAKLGCSIKAVESRIYHGRKCLRAELERRLGPRCFHVRRVSGLVPQRLRPRTFRATCKGFRPQRRMDKGTPNES